MLGKIESTGILRDVDDMEVWEDGWTDIDINNLPAPDNIIMVDK